MDVKVPGPVLCNQAAQNVPATHSPTATHRTSRPSSFQMSFSPVISRVGMGLVFAVPMAGGISDMRADAGSPTSLSLRKRPLLCTQGPRTHPDPSVSSPGSPLPFEAFAF